MAAALGPCKEREERKPSVTNARTLNVGSVSDAKGQADKKKKVEGRRTNRRNLKAQFHLLGLQYALHVIEMFSLVPAGLNSVWVFLITGVAAYRFITVTGKKLVTRW